MAFLFFSPALADARHIEFARARNFQEYTLAAPLARFLATFFVDYEHSRPGIFSGQSPHNARNRSRQQRMGQSAMSPKITVAYSKVKSNYVKSRKHRRP
jgi:hypothetical protein